MKPKHRISVTVATVFVGIGIIASLIFIMKTSGVFVKSGEIDTELFSNPLRRDDVFGSAYSRDTVKTVEFRNELLNCPDTAWDISRKKDKSVMAWVENADEGLYALIIACNTDCSSVANCENMFDGYTQLTHISFNGCLDTSKVSNMEWMFAHCSNLIQIDLSGIDTSGAKKMNCMFYECSKLQVLDLTGFDTSRAEKMYAMFHSCSSLTKLDLSNFDTSHVTEMDGMFDGCSQLSELSIESFDTSGVTNMCGMFGGCEKLESLDLGNFNTSKVTDMSGMFSHCTNLRMVNLSSFDFRNVKTMSYMFDECACIQDLDMTVFREADAEKKNMFSGTIYE